MTQITSVLAIATVFIGYGLYYLHFIVTKGGLMRWGGVAGFYGTCMDLYPKHGSMTSSSLFWFCRSIIQLYADKRKDIFRNVDMTPPFKTYNVLAFKLSGLEAHLAS